MAISILSFNIVKTRATSAAIYETHSYTKAICNPDNYCQDYVISCNRHQILGMSPITGSAVQFSDGWQDPRDEETINGFCG